MFFFFQAEDGIRDVAVTGVQTCALPICIYLRNAHREVANGEMSMVSLYAYAGGRSALSLMTVNRNLEAAWKYHNATKHSRSEEHTSELQSRLHLVCRLLLEKKK